MAPEARGWPEAAFSAPDVYPDNPALGLAAPIFDLLSRVQRSSAPPDVDSLHRTLIRSLQDFELQLTGAGVSNQHARLTLYALAASVDDGVLKTSWGPDSNWSSRTMISVFFHEAWGGERFFSLLNQMLGAQQTLMREIEFFYFCLEFGFEGKYRLAANGSAELTKLRERIYKVLYQAHGAPQSDLSPVWQGVQAANRQLRDFLPVWIGALGVLVLLLGIYAALISSLHHGTSLAQEKVLALLAPPEVVLTPPAPVPPVAPPHVTKVPISRPADPPPAPKAPAKPEKTPFEIISAMLQPEQQEGVLKVLERNGQVVIRTVGEVFASASTQVRQPFVRVVNDVGTALQATKGAIEVVGYTDSLPIHTSKFPSNVALSQGRADSVARMLRADLDTGRAIRSIGRGSADPIETNNTPQGRQANRRVEIVLTPQ
ncbi:type IVB secretion system protein IcmH/DotU [Xanthobacter sp. TB0139]